MSGNRHRSALLSSSGQSQLAANLRLKVSDEGSAPAMLDCLVIGGGPAGLTGAVYLARFRRKFLVVDSGESRAARVPISHNHPGFRHGIAGKALLARQRMQARRYGAEILRGEVVDLERATAFRAHVREPNGACRELEARTVLLATGVVDIAPELADLSAAVRRGQVRYCPICDAYEASDRKIGILGAGKSGLGEALFMRHYTAHVTLLTLGRSMDLDADDRVRLAESGVRVIEHPVSEVLIENDRVTALKTAGGTHQFDLIYSALGCEHRSNLAGGLGAEIDAGGAVVVAEHQRTSISGLYAAGDVVAGLNQICVAQAQAAIAATDIHNRLRGG